MLSKQSLQLYTHSLASPKHLLREKLLQVQKVNILGWCFIQSIFNLGKKPCPLSFAVNKDISNIIKRQHSNAQMQFMNHLSWMLLDFLFFMRIHKFCKHLFVYFWISICFCLFLYFWIIFIAIDLSGRK